jgi:hypothetical protein
MIGLYCTWAMIPLLYLSMTLSPLSRAWAFCVCGELIIGIGCLVAIIVVAG